MGLQTDLAQLVTLRRFPLSDVLRDMYEADRIGFHARVDDAGGGRPFARLHGLGETAVLKYHFASKELAEAESVVTVGEHSALRMKVAEQENKRLRQFYALLEDLMKSNCQPYESVAPKYHNPSSGDEHIPIFLISDSQIGLSVEKIVTGGLAEYSWDIFCERVERWKHGCDSFVTGVYRKVFPLHTAFLIFAGDIGEGAGTIYPKQPFKLCVDSMNQVFKGADKMCGIVRHVAGLFERVIAIMCWGNHGEVMNTTINLDWMCYRWMQERLRDQKNVFIDIPSSHYRLFYIDESLGLVHHPRSGWPTWTGAVIHGSNVRGWMQVPAYGFNKATAQYQEMTGVVIDALFAGHHHQEAKGGKWHINGSWCGGTDLSVEAFRSAARPGQSLFMYHPWQGLTAQHTIHLADPVRLEKDGKGFWGEPSPEV